MVGLQVPGDGLFYQKNGELLNHLRLQKNHGDFLMKEQPCEYTAGPVAVWLMSVSQIKVLDFRVLFRSEICNVKKRHCGHEK